MYNLKLVSKRGLFEAKGRYDETKKEFTVLKGSRVSSFISDSQKFRGLKVLRTRREAYTKDNILTCDMVFKSASTAANFVTGRSTNGLRIWKDVNGKTLKELLDEQ